MFLPHKLKTNSKIGIITPSNVLNMFQYKEFINGQKALYKAGFETFITPNFNIDTQDAKIDDFHHMFESKEVDAIICAQGGDKSQELIPHINWGIIQNNPKIFMGMSDITAFLNAINIKTDLITFHGPDVRSILGKGYDKYSMEGIENRLVMAQKGEIRSIYERKVCRSGQATGKIIGGNLKCFLKLIDLGFDIDFRNKIFFMELLDFNENEVRMLLEKLMKIDSFPQVSGIVTGYIAGLQENDYTNTQFEGILMEYVKDFSFPIMKIGEFGHRCENAILPIGCEIKMDTEDLSLEILEDFIK